MQKNKKQLIMTNTHQQTNNKSNIESSIKQSILNHYFPKGDLNDLSECEFSIRYKDSMILRIFFFPKTTYRTYFLIVKCNGIELHTHVHHKEKEILKIVLKSL